MSGDAPPNGARPGGFQVFSDLDESTFAALKESIAARGVLVPIAVDQHGRIIDGHNRARAAEDLGVDCPQVVVEVVDHADAKDIALLLNTVRRHLDTDRRRQVVAELRAAGHSLRAIAGAVGVDDKTVRNDLAKATAEGSAVEPPERTQGLDGKTRPSRRPEPEVDRSRCTSCKGPAFHPIDGLCTTCAEKAAAPAPRPIRPRPPTPEQTAAEEDEQRWRMDTARISRALCDLGVGFEVAGHAELVADHWDAAEAERVLIQQMRWVATPEGVRRVAVMLCDFADLREQATAAHTQEATG